MGMADRARHFARVFGIVGDSLIEKRVAVIGVGMLATVVRMLAASGVRRWLWAEEDARLRDHLARQHGPALDAEITRMGVSETGPPDLVIGAGNRADLARTLEIARAAACAALWIDLPSSGHACRATLWLEGETHTIAPAENAGEVDDWAWATSAPLCAGLARALLLRGTAVARADLGRLWTDGTRVFAYGGADALRVTLGDVGAQPAAIFQTPLWRRGCLLIAGLGSLGSVAAVHLRAHFERMLLVDPDRVDIYNPVRQSFPLAAIGRAKAEVLAEELAGVGLAEALTDEGQVAELVERYGVTAALVTTGTNADFAIARALRQRGVPHVVGRCYPRARYWEAILVDGRRGAAFEEMRGHIGAGPAAPPTLEERALYADPNALEGEPATLVESGWAAAWMARLTAQLAAPPGLRERWMLELLDAGRTCLIGGVGVTETGDGAAYEIELPGQITAWQRPQLA